MKRFIGVPIGIVLLVVVLGVAAYVGGQLFRVQARAQAENNTQNAPRKLFTPAPGMPMQDPTARGDVQQRDGNTLTICDPRDGAAIGADGSTIENGTCGPMVQIVIGHDTVIWHDVTHLRNPVKPKEGEDFVISQVLEPGTADEIFQHTTVRVWGVRSGDRVTAETLLYWNNSPIPVIPQ